MTDAEASFAEGARGFPGALLPLAFFILTPPAFLSSLLFLGAEGSGQCPGSGQVRGPVTAGEPAGDAAAEGAGVAGSDCPGVAGAPGVGRCPGRRLAQPLPFYPTCAYFPCLLLTSIWWIHYREREGTFLSPYVRLGWEMRAIRLIEGHSVLCYFSRFTHRLGTLQLKETLEFI